MKHLWFNIIGLAVSLLACNRSEKSNSNQPAAITFDPVHMADGARGDDAVTLVNCLTENGAVCFLPYITNSTGDKAVQIESILARTLISDDWMLTRFKERLAATRPEIISMFSCAKGVVISRNIRPAGFYNHLTGAIYLDSTFFAQSAEELATVNRTADIRSSNYANVANNILQDLVPNNADRYSLENVFSRLISHELTHACDFKSKHETGRFLSDDIPTAPQNAVYDLSQWLNFGDHNAKVRYESFSPNAVKEAFETASVIDPYGYANQQENLAMYVQDMLMFEFEGYTKVHYMLNQEKSAVGKPVIHWGIRGKICQPEMLALAQSLASRVVPSGVSFTRALADCSLVHYDANTQLD